ncbi:MULTISPECIES: hypothetical protein [Streptomyces]|uniref:hypothetical protein n=1 Tax=Streptomyces TaxID=1883 RepID=UPI00368B5FF4
MASPWRGSPGIRSARVSDTSIREDLLGVRYPKRVRALAQMEAKTIENLLGET